MTDEQKQNMAEATAAEQAGTSVLVDFSEAQLAALSALRVEKSERDEYATRAVNTMLRSGIASKITSCVKKIYDEQRKNNTGNVTRLTATLKELEFIAAKL